MLFRLVVLALLLAVAPAALASGAPAAASAPSVHYVPQAGDWFTFAETVAVSGGYGTYAGYTETDSVVGNLSVTAVQAGGTETASYSYSGTYANSTGTHYPWSTSGSFTFSATSLDYVSGTDNESGYAGSEVWFYINNTVAVGGSLDPLDTPMTVASLDTSYPLATEGGRSVATVYAAGNGSYARTDAYGDFNATYDQRSYFDPSTGYIVGFAYVEQDSNGHGDGFVYTDTLGVTKSSFALTPSTAPPTYTVTVTETGLASGTGWTAMFDGVSQSGSTGALTFPGLADGTYLYSVRAAGYTASPAVGTFTVSASHLGATVTFQSAGASSPSWTSWLPYLLLGIVVVIVVVVIALALARRARRGPPLPRHSAGGTPTYGAPPPGPAPPPISLHPSDQPQIQQVVVKEVVKVNCRYCGSLIDSTAPACPFCGATRT